MQAERGGGVKGWKAAASDVRLSMHLVLSIQFDLLTYIISIIV